MVSKTVHLLGQPVWRERFEGLDNVCVQDSPPLLEQAAVGHLVGEGVLEGILVVGKEPGLVEELGRLQVGEAAMQRSLGHRLPGAGGRRGFLR